MSQNCWASSKMLQVVNTTFLSCAYDPTSVIRKRSSANGAIKLMWQRRTAELAVWCCKQNNAKKLGSFCASILSLFINFKKKVWMNSKTLKQSPFARSYFFTSYYAFCVYCNFRRNNTDRWLADPAVTLTNTSVPTDFFSLLGLN
jgi:hypothetical protein